MISGIDLNQKFDYVSKHDKENPTTWELGVIPVSVMGQFAQAAQGANVNQFDMALQVVQVGLKGWRNFGDIEYKTEKVKVFNKEVEAVPETLLARIPMFIIAELAEKIIEVNKLNPDEQKN